MPYRFRLLLIAHQVHRELASALSCAVGFKNGTDGSIDIAIDAMRAAATGHTFLSVTKQGLSAIVETEGNPFTHVILRGSSKGPNYAAEHVKACADKLTKAGLAPRLMVDCSHGNSSKQHTKQMEVGKSIVSAAKRGSLRELILRAEGTTRGRGDGVEYYGRHDRV